MNRVKCGSGPPDPRLLRAFAVSFLLLLFLTLLCVLKADAAGDRQKFRRTAVPEDAQESVEAAENEPIEAALLEQAHVIESCAVTHYDCCTACCGKADGITASGVQAVPYVSVAVDPAVIPLGSDVLVDYGDGELCYYRADDTGAGVEGAQIDLCVRSHEEAVTLGVRTATVYWIPPEEG